MRVHKIKLFLCVPLLLAMLSGCKEKIPPSNTPAYYALHGIVNDGKTVNEITLFNDQTNNHPKLRFPPDVFVSVETTGLFGPNPQKIRKGYAYSATVYLDWSDEHKLKPRLSDHSHEFIHITFYAGVNWANINWTEDRLREISQRSARTTDKEWGMREYVQVIRTSQEVSEYEYVPLDKNFRAIDGDRIWMRCQGEQKKLESETKPTVGLCMSNFFNYKNGVMLIYYFQPNLLPYWRTLHTEVLKFADSILVNE